MNPGLSTQSLALELQATAFPTVNSELKCRDEPVLSGHPQGICGWPLYMSASHRSHGIGDVQKLLTFNVQKLAPKYY